jgi:hypothetical protein
MVSPYEILWHRRLGSFDDPDAVGSRNDGEGRKSDEQPVLDDARNLGEPMG